MEKQVRRGDVRMTRSSSPQLCIAITDEQKHWVTVQLMGVDGCICCINAVRTVHTRNLWIPDAGHHKK